MAERNRKPVAITIKGDPAWREWIETVAQAAHLPVSLAIEHAMIDFAKKHKVATKPPQRLPSVAEPMPEPPPGPGPAKARRKPKGGD